jgi:bd-type cytochrome oxidase subunit II
MVMFWVSLFAISILLYVLLDGVDLGAGLLFGLTIGEARRGAMLSAVAPIWDGNETWLVITAVILWGAFPVVNATLLSAFYLPLIVMLLGLILRGVAFEFRYKTWRPRWIWDLSFAGGSRSSLLSCVKKVARVLGLLDEDTDGSRQPWPPRETRRRTVRFGNQLTAPERKRGRLLGPILGTAGRQRH